jgi:hypothetical protein
MAAKKKSSAKTKPAKPARKASTPKRTAKSSPKSAAKPAKKAAPPSGDVVYTDVRRTVSSRLLGRLLGG